MKSKILLTSALALTIACPAMAETLPVIDDCVQSEIGVSEGTASLEADWSANVINLTWENNGATTGATGGASTCTYAETFTLPQAPTRTGYNFAGWKVKPSAFDLSTLDTSIRGTGYGYSRLNGDAGKREADYNLTQGSREWATGFSYGIVKGKAVCTNDPKPSGIHKKGDKALDKGYTGNETGLYCWCQATGFDAEKDGTYMSVNVSSSSWVYAIWYDGADHCARACLGECAYGAQVNVGFRAALFGLAAN